MSNKPDITPQLALSAARVLRDYYRQFECSCKKCVIKKSVCDSPYIPEEWELQEREDEDAHEYTD